MMKETNITPGLWLRSLLFFILYNLMGIVHSLVSLALAPFQTREQRHRFVNHWTRATMWLLRRLNGIEIEVEGRENLPHDEPVVIMANHQSEWETFYLQLLISPQATVLKRELLWVPFFGWALALLEPIAIDRGKPVNALKTLLRVGKQRLDQGVSVVIYPEGRASRRVRSGASMPVARVWPVRPGGACCPWPTMPATAGRRARCCASRAASVW
jgi:1-acyl-sn-glycerol-3-phosphate acyltransferase